MRKCTRRIGSAVVSSKAVIGRLSNCLKLKIAGSLEFPTGVASARGNLDKPSALACCLVGRN